MPPANVLVMEVGGTNLRAAVFDPVARTLTDRAHASSPNYLNANGGGDLQGELVERLRRLGADVLRGRHADVVAVAYPGPVDRHGNVLATPTVLGDLMASPYPLRRVCARLWPDAAVFVMNDMTATGYRYVHRGLRDFCVITIGSGVGHKVFIDGEPLIGSGGRGGEIGHLRVDADPNAVRCDCGGIGHLGGIASGRGSVRVLRRLAERDPTGFGASLLGGAAAKPSEIDTHAVADAFRRGDQWVRSGIEMPVAHLGHALAAIHLAVGVEHFVLVGGFAFAMGEQYRRMLAQLAEPAGWMVGQDWDEMIRFGIPDDDQGLIGAGLVVLRQRLGDGA